MCGIVGAIAQRDVADILIEGLKRLEYRGYDSAGIALLTQQPQPTITQEHVNAKIKQLEQALQKNPLKGQLGIAHTRWATHGAPSTENAHPHCSNNTVTVVHNGIIENHSSLREALIKDGYQFHSETDSEVICHLIHQQLVANNNPQQAIFNTTKKLKGAYALGVIINDTPDILYSVKKGSPLVIGVGIGEHFIASDTIALLPVTQKFIYLQDNDIAVITKDNIDIFNENKKITRDTHQSKQEENAGSKGEYRHFMLKEIHEQPQALIDTLNGYIINGSIATQAFGHKAEKIFEAVEHIQIVACGTSYHAALIAQHWIESQAQIPCRVDIASEYRYKHNIIEPNTLFITISQSGETADTIAALEHAKKQHIAASLSICNTAESSLARQSDLIFLTRAGTEVGVAATKTFTTQLLALLLLSLSLKKTTTTTNHADTLQSLPNLINEILKLDTEIEQIAKQFTDKNHALFLGRGIHYPIAMEGALKLKEISYMHAEAYPAGELKHGPLALVDKEMPVIVIAPKNNLSEKLMSNIKEVEARGGQIYMIGQSNKHWSTIKNATIINLPTIPELISPILYTIPLQLLAYYIAIEKGTDVDQPRNLAKSVTVE